MRDHPGHTQIMNAFESLLLKRKIAVDGLVIDMSGEAQLIQMYDGIVEDVRMDHPLRQDPGPYLVMIGGDGEHTYVAAETITALLFQARIFEQYLLQFIKKRYFLWQKIFTNLFGEEID